MNNSTQNYHIFIYSLPATCIYTAYVDKRSHGNNDSNINKMLNCSDQCKVANKWKQNFVHSPSVYRIHTSLRLTSLAVTPECDTELRAENGNPEAHLEYRLWNRWPRWSDYSHVALRGVSHKLTICGGVSISHAPYLPCLTDTISCSNHCMLTLHCLIGHSTVISRRPTMRNTGTGN